jgi:hypothetical protein
MKHTLLVLLGALCLGLASCSGGGNADVATIKKQTIDSISGELEKRGIHVNFSVQANAATVTLSTAPITNYYYPADKADTMVQSYHALFKKNAQGFHQPAVLDTANLNRTAFVIPANTLQQLLNAPNNCPYVAFYIGYDNSTKLISLFYTGVVPVPNFTDSFTEITMINPTNNRRSVFDNGYPCPTCNYIGIHTLMGPFNSQIFAWVKADENGASGTISPSGTVNVKYGTSQAFTFTPGANCVVDTFWVDDTAFFQGNQRFGTQYTFGSVKEEHQIDVRFKRNK